MSTGDHHASLFLFFWDMTLRPRALARFLEKNLFMEQEQEQHRHTWAPTSCRCIPPSPPCRGRCGWTPSALVILATTTHTYSQTSQLRTRRRWASVYLDQTTQSHSTFSLDAKTLSLDVNTQRIPPGRIHSSKTKLKHQVYTRPARNTRNRDTRHQYSKTIKQIKTRALCCESWHNKETATSIQIKTSCIHTCWGV